MPGELFIDDYDLQNLGVTISSEIEGDLDAPARRWDLVSVPGRLDAVVRTGSAQVIRPRTLVFVGAITAADHASMLTNLKSLKYRLSPDEVRVRTASGSTLEWLARCEALIARPLGLAFGPARELEFRFICPNPHRRSTTESNESLSSTPQAIALGNARSNCRVRINGAVTDPVLTYKHYDTTTLATMSFTKTLGAGEWIEIDTAARTIVDDGGANVLADLDSGSEWPVLDPRDGDYLASQWPTLELSAGTGTVWYYKRWE